MSFGENTSHVTGTLRTPLMQGADNKTSKVFNLLTALQDAKTKQACAENATLKAEAANKAKSDFLTNMIHEIRTPVGAIIGLAQVLNAAYLTDKQKNCLYLLQNCAENLIEMINGSLNIDRIESLSVNLDNAPFNLHVLLQHIVSVMSIKAAEKNIDLALVGPPGLPKNYIGDSGRIRQIMMNLVGNAIKFTETGGVTIFLAGGDDNAGNHVYIAVTDTGIGIAEDKIGVVFDRFVQADPSIAYKFGGSGLGLSISKALAESMGGTLTVTSIEEKGSTFTLRLCLPTAQA